MNKPEYIDVYKRMGAWHDKTYQFPYTGIRLKQGKNFIYFVPYGLGYECEDGIHIEMLNQKEFDSEYSLVYLL